MVIHLYLWNKKYISSKIKKYTIRLCHVKILQSLKRMRPSLGHACARLMKFVIHDRHFFFCQKKSRRIKRKKKRRKKLQVLGLQRALSIQWYYILFCQWKCLFVTLSFLMYCLFLILIEWEVETIFITFVFEHRISNMVLMCLISAHLNR